MEESRIDRVRLGLNIRMRRHIMRLTQAELGRRVGCTSRKISAIEHGKRDVSISLLIILSDALECPLEQLLFNVK